MRHFNGGCTLAPVLGLVPPLLNHDPFFFEKFGIMRNWVLGMTTLDGHTFGTEAVADNLTNERFFSILYWSMPGQQLDWSHAARLLILSVSATLVWQACPCVHGWAIFKTQKKQKEKSWPCSRYWNNRVKIMQRVGAPSSTRWYFVCFCVNQGRYLLIYFCYHQPFFLSIFCPFLERRLFCETYYIFLFWFPDFFRRHNDGT